MPRTDSLVCTCCHLSRAVRPGGDQPFICDLCRSHVGASVESSARRAETHAGWYWAMWKGAEDRVEKLRVSVERAGYKIERLQSEVDSLRGAQGDDPATLTLIERIRALHHIVLQTGKCSCGRDAKCPTLRVIEAA